jgi:hypothetical protein
VYVCTPLRICKPAAAVAEAEAEAEVKDKRRRKKGIGQKQDGKAAGKRTRDPADKRSKREQSSGKQLCSQSQPIL